MNPALAQLRTVLPDYDSGLRLGDGQGTRTLKPPAWRRRGRMRAPIVMNIRPGQRLSGASSSASASAVRLAARFRLLLPPR
jgi:hypothetical protein